MLCLNNDCYFTFSDLHYLKLIWKLGSLNKNFTWWSYNHAAKKFSSGKLPTYKEVIERVLYKNKATKNSFKLMKSSPGSPTMT